MRIIAGTSKGMRLVAPPGLTVRPTSDLVRGAAMSQLGGFFQGQVALDLCAGTGAVALEWLSRGCSRAVAVEQSPEVAKLLRENATHTRLATKLEVIVAPADAALRTLAQRGEKFDLVWFDPPYDAGLHPAILKLLAELPVLQPEADVLVESRNGLDPAWLGDAWEVVSTRRYGACWLDRLTRRAP